MCWQTIHDLRRAVDRLLHYGGHAHVTTNPPRKPCLLVNRSGKPRGCGLRRDARQHTIRRRISGCPYRTMSWRVERRSLDRPLDVGWMLPETTMLAGSAGKSLASTLQKINLSGLVESARLGVRLVYCNQGVILDEVEWSPDWLSRNVHAWEDQIED